MDQKISDLDVAISMTASDLIPIVDANGNNKVLHGSQVKDYVADAIVSDIDDVKAMISDAYDNTATYAVGDYCIYNNTLYRCTTEISTAENFNPAHWVNTTIGEEMQAIILTSSLDHQTFAANTCNVLNFVFDNLPAGYQIISVYDNSYWAGVIGVPIRIRSYSDTLAKTVVMNYLIVNGLTDKTLTVRAIAVKNPRY